MLSIIHSKEISDYLPKNIEDEEDDDSCPLCFCDYEESDVVSLTC